MDELKIAVLIPCYNEEKTIGNVVASFKEHLPKSKIYVYDNNSNDNTVSEAQKAGAIVKHEKRQGKGNVVRRMFSDIDANYYILIDGDNTYDVSGAKKLLNELIENDLDMVVGSRKQISDKSYPMGHVLGNLMFNKIVSTLFGRQFDDIFSGYRAFSRKFVKTFPCSSTGFEIETELSVHALEMNLAVSEIALPYASRPEGSESKLSTFKDGFKILGAIVKFLIDLKPLMFFMFVFSGFAVISLTLFIPILMEYFNTGLVPRIPTFILVSSFALVGIICVLVGLILESVSRAKKHVNWLIYLSNKNSTDDK